MIRFKLSFLLFTVLLCTSCGNSKTKADEPARTPKADAPVVTEALLERQTEPQKQPKPTPSNQGFLLQFDQDTPGSVPTALKISETFGQDKTATWSVVSDPTAPSAPNVFGITINKNSGRTYNMVLAHESSALNVDVSVKVKAVEGKEDQGGGPVWRALDGNNYYIARWNPLEDNFRIYFVKDGNRRQIASANIKLDPAGWHEIRVTMRGQHIEAWINGKKEITVDDVTFTKAGMAGLWIKADGQTLFDDFSAEQLEN